MPSEIPVLAANDVTVAYPLGREWRRVVRNVTLHIASRQVYGLVGESGSGKSTLALAIMRYLAGNARILSGEIRLDGDNLLDKSMAEMRRLWRTTMALVPQDPAASLNPALRVGQQLAEMPGLSRYEAQRRALDLLRQVRIADAERVAHMYPHQLSGGMQQRILIAMALSAEPRLLVLDEPTTNLDVTTEAVILDLFKELIGKRGSATLYVTHNLGVVAQMCHRVAVMYAGEIVEDAAVDDLFARPLHPYTITLLNAVPRLDRMLPGSVPSTGAVPHAVAGCVFAARCPLALAKCFEVKPLVEASGQSRTVNCHRWAEIAAGGLQVAGQARRVPADEISQDVAPLLTLNAVSKSFSVQLPAFDRLRRRARQSVKAVDQVSLAFKPGQVVGLVGESGSGKTTLARCIVGLVERDSGQIEFRNTYLAPAVERRPMEVLRRLQMVFQSPDESLNPYLTIGEILRRPLQAMLKYSRARADARVAGLLRAVQLPDSYANRLPGELSGGEKQRVAISRAFATDPDFIVCDEAVSALDVSVQASILDLLKTLQIEQRTSYLFISHDLAVLSQIADVIVVMYLGQLFDIIPQAQLLSTPLHPYTEALLSAIPIPDPAVVQGQRIRLESDVPSPVNLPTGCRFHTRCPRKWGPLCEQQEPPWQDAGNGHHIRCHFPLDELASVQAVTLQKIRNGT